MRVLIIEDEPRLNEHLRKGLSQHGYVTDAAGNGTEGLELAAVGSYDLIVLDLMLPGQSGLEVLDNLKRFNIQTPVLIVSALSSTDHVIEGLDRGAADYIKKPFDFGEFLARVRAITRKRGGSNVTRLRIGELTQDLVTRKVTVGDQEVNLTNREFALLELLMSNANRVVSKVEIAERVWEVNFDMSSNVIEVHLSQLRKKLGADWIQTKVGMGYYIEGNLRKSDKK